MINGRKKGVISWGLDLMSWSLEDAQKHMDDVDSNGGWRMGYDNGGIAIVFRSQSAAKPWRKRGIDW